MAVAFDAAGGGVNSATSPLTWTHTPVGTPTAIIVGATSFATNANTVTAVTYGGVSMASLGYIASGSGGTHGGIALYYLASGIPAGAQTVSVTSTGGGDTIGGSVSFTGSSGHGTAVTANSASGANSQTVVVSSTTAGGMIATVCCFGGDTSGSSFSGTNSVTVRYQDNASTNSSSDNSAGGTVASAGGNQTVGFSNASVGTDDWGIVAVELLPPPSSGPVFYPSNHSVQASRPAKSRLAGIYMGLGSPGVFPWNGRLNDTSFGTGQVMWNSGGPVINPPPAPQSGPLPNFPVIIAVNSGWRNAGHSW